ncbi:MAG TPA: Rho termination factor N-terminal domain-containing protein [Ktedonobacteraceae bacterium]|nr:Rho termination factor N-terminal domain-containing protein [Ktedonobacteraceae bacterium]
MYDIVPGALQHLREADIISMAGLAVAAQGQEYSRTSAVHSTHRQGSRLSGIVDVGGLPSKADAIGTNAAKAVEFPGMTLQSFPVTVEINDANTWHFTCACTPVNSSSLRLCVHAAALLYYWLARPFAFAASPTAATPSIPSAPSSSLMQPMLPTKPALSTPTVAPVQPTKTADSLALLAPPDLRTIAKEYELASNGLNKQEMIEAILGVFRQPEVVRRMVGTLEKMQRQFLATFTLAGGYMSDQELRGLFERFALGKQEQYQQAMAKLQSKGLILRASFNSTQQLRAGLGGSSNLSNLNPLEVTWHVPPEVCSALTITLPVAPFRAEEQSAPPVVYHAEPYRLLADLLLVARVLEGQLTPREEKSAGRRGITGSLMRAVQASPSPSSASPSPEGSVAIPPPAGLLPSALLETLQGAVTLSPAFLRFAYRILRLGEILYTETDAPQAASTTNGASVTLRMLPNAAELLLGPTRSDVTLELFSHWLRQATYIELFELSELGLRLRCRTIAPNQPALRQGELEAENREARQWLISLLAQAPLRQWISFPAFARFVFRLYPTFLQRRQHLFPTPHWWIEQDEGRPLHPEQWNDWQRADARYLAQLLQGPLYWWGTCDIALTPGGQLQAFRLTPLAEHFLHDPGSAHLFLGFSADQRSDASTDPVALDSLGAGPEEQEAHPTSHTEPVEPAMYDMSGIELSEQGDVLVISSAGNWPLIELVERFTRVTGVQAGRLRYQITPAALSEALRRGEDLAPFVELLRCARDAGQGNGRVEAMLSRLEQRLASYGRIRLYTGATLLAAADTLTLRELAATTSIEQQTIQAVHPTLLVLKKQGSEQLIDELKRRGQAPLLHGDE